MPELQFQIESATTVEHSAAPLLVLRLRITNSSEQTIHTIILRCQVQIEPARRSYIATEKEKLLDLFGTPDRWSRTVRPLLWMNTSVVVPTFAHATVVDLELPCTFDFNVAATKYFHALDSGEIPLRVMFSGTIFYRGAADELQIAQVPWDREATFRLSVSVWKQMMDAHHPNSALIWLGRDTFERLYRFKVQRGIPTWDEAVERALSSEDLPKVGA